MVLDGLQQPKYYALSPYWNPNHEANQNLTWQATKLCSELQLVEFNSTNKDKRVTKYWQTQCNGIQELDFKLGSMFGVNQEHMDALMKDAICFARMELYTMLTTQGIEQNNTVNTCQPKLDKGYFICSLLTWILPPLLFIGWALKAINDLYMSRIIERIKDMVYLMRRWEKVARVICLVALLPLTLPFLLLIAILVMYVKLPFDVIRHALVELGWLPESCCEISVLNWIRFNEVDAGTHNKFMKSFEQFGEAIPQFAVALTFYLNNRAYMALNDSKILGVPTTVISIVVSVGSIVLGKALFLCRLFIHA